jgi:DHA1 family bicyclomycin/chloramphenicol resistance-like MFS transporter
VSSSFLSNALVLGLLTAIGPFAIDMYLPALPSIGASLGTNDGAVQLTLMTFFVAMGACQLICGPLSDIFGRKPPLFFGLLLFSVCAIGCALAPNVETLILFRFVQGIGACVSMVIPRAVVRDLHTGPDAAKLMSLLMLVFSVSPILAPLTGSLIVKFAGWRALFWAVALLGLLGLALSVVGLAETRPRALRRDSSLTGALAAYRQLLGDRRFLGISFLGAFGTASFFTYLANSSFVLIGHFGLTPSQFSLFFSINAIAFIGAAQFNGWLSRRLGLSRQIRTAIWGYVAAMSVLFLLTLAGLDSLFALAALLFVGFAFLGLVIPTATVLAMEEHGTIAGTASALMGTLQFVTGAVVVAILGPFANGTPLPMVTGIAGSAVASVICCLLTLSSDSRIEVPAE